MEMVEVLVAQAQTNVVKGKVTVIMILNALVILNVDKAMALMTIVMLLLDLGQHGTAAMTLKNVNSSWVKKRTVPDIKPK